jgi:hypothetical protein
LDEAGTEWSSGHGVVPPAIAYDARVNSQANAREQVVKRQRDAASADLADNRCPMEVPP